MYIQKKNGAWWLRENLTSKENGRSTLNINLGKNFKKARKRVAEEVEKCSEGYRETYRKKLLEKMDEIEKVNPSYVTLKITYRQYEKIKQHLPPEFRNL